MTKIDGSWKVVSFFGAPGNGLGQLSMAHDIAVTQNGDIMITHLDGRVQLISLE